MYKYHSVQYIYHNAILVYSAVIIVQFMYMCTVQLSQCTIQFRCTVEYSTGVQYSYSTVQVYSIIVQNRLSHLLVGRVGAHESQLDRVEGVGGQDLREEAGVDHRGLGQGSTLCNEGQYQ